MSRNPNRMQEATDRLMGQFQQAASVPVTYTQGTTIITGIKATVGRTPFEVLDGQVAITFESRDYLIAKSDLMGLIPQNGDAITEANGRRYEVLMPKPLNVYESIGPDGVHALAVGS